MTMSDRILGQPRPLGRVLLLSAFSLSVYYLWYKWIIQEELRKYNGEGWSGNLCVLPFVLGVIFPQVLWILDPDVDSWFGWFSLSGIVWIYIVELRLYRTVNQLYRREEENEPLVIWWLFVPGLNIIAGLRQIHFLSQYWLEKQNLSIQDSMVESSFSNS